MYKSLWENKKIHSKVPREGQIHQASSSRRKPATKLGDLSASAFQQAPPALERVY